MSSGAAKLKAFAGKQNSSLVLLIVFLIISRLLSPQFLSFQNLLNILWGISALGIVALGQTILMITGNFDMSVAYIVGLSGITAVMSQIAGASLAASIALGLAVGVLVGLLNGAIVVFTKANAFLITLGTSILVYSVNLILTKSKTWSVKIEDFLILGRGKLFGVVHYSVIIFLVLAVILYIFLRKTVTGRYLYIIGLNKKVAQLTGININAIVLGTYALCGFTAALAGLIMTARTGSTVANAGVGMDFDSMIASVLGGASLFGGRGHTLYTVVGMLILGILNNILILINFPYEAQQIAKGLVFIIVVWADGFSRKERI
ncbi:MAG: ABC transporter permease [Treponema sp.]|jgi:ribose transport system permease protein|nr:ABC transporter permease [Treponema sp.]